MIRAGGDYRLFNRLKLSKKNGQVLRVAGDPNDPLVGITPDPCPLPIGGMLGLGDPEVHFANGATGTRPSGSIYLINEGRIGTTGQMVDRTLNNPGTPVGQTTPWIWNVIRFDAGGDLLPLDHQIFPTYYVYVNGMLVQQFPQDDLETFLSLDSTSQRLVHEIP